MGEIFSISPISLPKVSPKPHPIPSREGDNGDEYFAFFRRERNRFPSSAKTFSVGSGIITENNCRERSLSKSTSESGSKFGLSISDTYRAITCL